MRIYIAGRITGRKIETAYKQFEDAELTLNQWGEEIVNPMRLPHDHDKSWKAYMVECITELVKCDAIYMLKGWNKSKGARLELHLAKKLNLKIFYQ